MNELLAGIGHRISSARKSKKMTQEALAELADVSYQTISSAELGKKALRPENIIKIGSVSCCSARTILSALRCCPGFVPAYSAPAIGFSSQNNLRIALVCTLSAPLFLVSRTARRAASDPQTVPAVPQLQHHTVPIQTGGLPRNLSAFRLSDIPGKRPWS